MLRDSSPALVLLPRILRVSDSWYHVGRIAWLLANAFWRCWHCRFKLRYLSLLLRKTTSTAAALATGFYGVREEAHTTTWPAESFTAVNHCLEAELCLRLLAQGTTSNKRTDGARHAEAYQQSRVDLNTVFYHHCCGSIARHGSLIGSRRTTNWRSPLAMRPEPAVSRDLRADTCPMWCVRAARLDGMHCIVSCAVRAINSVQRGWGNLSRERATRITRAARGACEPPPFFSPYMQVDPLVFGAVLAVVWLFSRVVCAHSSASAPGPR